MFEDLRELYQEVILDHDRNPWNLLQPADASREVLGNNPLWGDVLTVYLSIGGAGVVKNAAFV